MRVGIFGSKYQVEKQSQIKRLFEKLISQEAEIYVDVRFYNFLTDILNYEPPVAGLLTDDNFDLGGNDIEDTLEELFKNYYKIEERTLLRLHTEERAFHGYNYALNEIAILKRDTSSMITIHTSLNDEYLASYQADGLLIATPTGSTAYSMSVNGPIIIPQSKNIVLSPVAPHSLNVRPLIIPDTYTITLGVESRNKSFLISLDGRSEIFPAGIQLTVTKADYTTKVIKRYNHTFYQTLREKLMWGADARMK